MLNLLQKSFSKQRLSTYQRIAVEKGLPEETAVELYKINILICEELYAFIDCVEVCLRNRIHNKMFNHTNCETWYDHVDWLKLHKDSLNNAKKAKYPQEIPSPNDVIARLNFGFWCHVFDSAYEQSLWIPALRFIFPNYVGAPSRKHISNIFGRLLKIRNRIAHFEPVIKDEAELLQSYNQFVEVMNWLDPEIYAWFETFNKFKPLYRKLKNNSFSEEI